MPNVNPGQAERDREYLANALTTAVFRSDVSITVRLLGYTDAFHPITSIEPHGAIPVSLTPGEIFVGPVATEQGGPCAGCLALRWQKLRSGEFRTVLETGGRLSAAGPNPFLTPFLVDTIAALVEHLADLDRNSTPGISAVYGIDAGTLHVQRYELLTDSFCSACSPVPSEVPEPIVLGRRPKPHPGTDRLATAQSLLRDPAALTNPAVGMLGKEVITEYAHTTTVPATGVFQVRGAWGLFPVHWSGHADSESDSTAFALCEGIERYAGLACAPVPTAAYDSYAALANNAIDPARCGLDPDSHQRGPFTPYHRDLPIQWVWGHHLTDDRPVLVPKQLVYYRGEKAEEMVVKETSNGCASGSCVEEAILHGIFELVERDAFLLAWYGAAPLAEIDPDTCASSSTRLLLERVRRLGYDVRAFDGRIDLDIPVVVVAARNRASDQLGALTLSAAAHLDPERALSSALREVASCVSHLAERTRSNLAHVRAMVEDFSRVTELADHALLYGVPEMAHHADFLLAPRARSSMAEVFADWNRRRPWNADLTDDVRFCLDHLTEAGFEVVAVDQTTPEGRLLGMHTVRVLVPGMIPIDFGWADQRALRMPRMFEAFRTAGWRATPLDPSELNRVPHPFM